MTKCDVCGEKIDSLFLGKIVGTYVRKDKKLKTVCSNCQRKLGNKVKEEV